MTNTENGAETASQHNGEKPKIAVLLAAYNGRRFIKEQLTSIIDQEDVNVTIFISVDSSSDGTEKICDKFAKKYSNIVCLKHGYRFGAAGPNFYRLFRDVDCVSFDFVALADQDDIWHPWKLHRATQVINSRNVDVYSSDVEAFWANGKRKLIKKSFPQTCMDHYFESAGPGCTFVFNSRAARILRRFFLAVPSNKTLPEPHDWLIYAYLRQQGLLWTIDDRPTLLYRQHATNQVGINSGVNAALTRLVKIRNKWYRDQVFDIFAICNPKTTNLLKDRRYLLNNWTKLRRSKRDRLILCILILLGVF